MKRIAITLVVLYVITILIELTLPYFIAFTTSPQQLSTDENKNVPQKLEIVGDITSVGLHGRCSTSTISCDLSFDLLVKVVTLLMLLAPYFRNIDQGHLTMASPL